MATARWTSAMKPTDRCPVDNHQANEQRTGWDRAVAGAGRLGAETGSLSGGRRGGRSRSGDVAGGAPVSARPATPTTAVVGPGDAAPEQRPSPKRRSPGP